MTAPLVYFTQVIRLDHNFWIINLDHNFWTRNPRRSSKVSKDSDYSLESNKNFSEILPSNSWRPGLGEVGHLWHKSSTYDITHKKPAPPNQKFFFECKLQDLLRLLTLQPGP